MKMNEKEYSKTELKEIALKLVNETKYYIDFDGDKVDIIKENTHLLNLGDFVSIRSCREKEKEELYLGIFVGTIPYFIGHNPTFYVFKLKETRIGAETWWQKIPEEDLDLGCNKIKEKNKFTWKDIENYIKERLKECKINENN